MKLKDKLKNFNIKKIDYRHYICIAITLGFLALSILVFPHALGRIIEGVRDFGVSCAYWFCELFFDRNPIVPTVNDLPKVPFFDFLENYETPVTSFPDTFAGFKEKWEKYWQIVFTKDNFVSYLDKVIDVLYYVSRFLVLALPFVFLLVVLFREYTKNTNNNYDKDSKPLIAFKKATAKTYIPVKNWLVEFYCFIRGHKPYWVIWLCLWIYNFNGFAIFAEFFAFYLYFSVSFDFSSIYRQLYKLVLDLWTCIDFIPLPIWILIGVVVLDVVARHVGYKRLYHNENCNRGFINERGVVTICHGVMGCGKTSQITDMALSQEVMFRDQAFEIILDTDLHFPNFPWINLENQLKQLCADHTIYDLTSCRKWIRSACNKWENDLDNKELIFNYDYKRYGVFYDDKLKNIYIWEALEDYACAYFIYIVQSALLVSNYSIRSDMLFSSVGNFPMWNSDFFKRDSRLLDSFSRHSHILDFDMMRLGKTMLKNNPNRFSFGFGVYVISEGDKERKNQNELKEIKATADEANQKNDQFNSLIKMSRHACVVANKVFVKIFMDMQRAESINADARELGDLVQVNVNSDMFPVLPFYSPFYLFDLLYGWLRGRFVKFYSNYRYMRGDNTLFMYILKGLFARLDHFRVRTYNLFDCQQLRLVVENGSREGDILERKYYRMSKKIYSKRYSTDCLSGIFETRAERNTVGLDDMAEFAETCANNYELGLMNSYFYNDTQTWSGVNLKEEKKNE
jgi:hypothetical protein